MRHWRAIGLLLAVITMPELVRAADVSISAFVDKDSVTQGEYFTFTVSVDGGQTGLPNPDMPPLDDFQIISGPMSSQNIQFTNGRIAASRSISYVLQPLKTGKLTIGPASVNANGQVFSSDPVSIEVIDVGRGQPAQGAPQQPQGGVDPGQQPAQPAQPQVNTTGEVDLSGVTSDLHLVCVVGNPNPFQGEQIQYRWLLFLSQRAEQRVRRAPVVWPDFSGFWGEEIENGTQARRIINNKQYLVFERNYALFPNSPGTTTIGPAKSKFEYDMFSAFGFSHGSPPGPTEIAGNAVLVNVKPLPPGAPQGFNHVVGSYSMNAGVDRRELKAGETLTLTLRVTGEGNLRALPKMEFKMLENAGFKVFDPDFDLTVDKKQYPVAGQWQAKVILVPREAGQKTIPSIEIPYFDSKSGQYSSLKSQPFSINVLPGEKAEDNLIVSGENAPKVDPVKALGKDIHYLQTSYHANHQDDVHLHQRGWSRWFPLAPPILTAGLIILARRRDRLSSDVGFARRRFADANLGKRFHEADAALAANKLQEFYAALSNALFSYIADQTNRHAAGLTSLDLDAVLNERNVGGELRRELLDILDTCNMGRFGSSGAGGTGEMRALLERARSLAQRLKEAF